MNDHTIDVEPERVVPALLMDISAALCEQRWSIRISFDCNALPAWKLHSGHDSNTCSKRECKAPLFLTVITFVMTGGGAKLQKAQCKNCKD